MPELPTLKAVNSSARVKAAGSPWKGFMAPGNSIDLILHFYMEHRKGQKSKLFRKKSELRVRAPSRVRSFKWKWEMRSQLQKKPDRAADKCSCSRFEPHDCSSRKWGYEIYSFLSGNNKYLQIYTETHGEEKASWELHSFAFFLYKSHQFIPNFRSIISCNDVQVTLTWPSSLGFTLSGVLQRGRNISSVFWIIR